MRASVPALTFLAVAGCVPRAAPPPAPAPAVALPPPPAPPPSADWRDRPATPGDWRYAAAPGGSVASYGSGTTALTLRCEGGAVLLARPGTAATALTVRTTGVARTLPAAAGTARLAAGDPLLDQMAFSRGRFVVEAPGAPAVVAPAWAEVGRVVEDCRR
jgi:hypothetical protein